MTDDNTMNRFDSTGHLTADSLDEVATGTEPVASVIGEHLASCHACSTRLGELQATVTLLRQIPEIDPPRSFALPPERARTAVQQPNTPAYSFSEKLYRWLLPAMPALRTATVGAFLLFLTVTVAANRFDENENGSDFAMQSEPTTALFEPVQTSAPSDSAGGDQSTDRSAESAAAQQSNEEESGANDVDDQELQSDATLSQDTVITEAVMQATEPVEAEAMEAAPAAAAPDSVTSDGADSSVASTQTNENELFQATPSPAATEVEEAQPAKASDNWSLWRFAQVALLAISVLLAALWVWLRRARNSS